MQVVCFDLDDTLSKEIVYLQSAYREIAQFAAQHCSGCQTPVLVLQHKAYEVMMQAYREGLNAFEALNDFLGLELPISDYLTLYRNHIPTISLSENIVAMLTQLKKEECILGVITDGRSVQQRHKIEALGLEQFFSNDNIIISEEFGSEKPSDKNYQYFMNRYPNAHQFVYVGDNPKKDFLAPNRLGWVSIGLRDNGDNIHSQSLNYPTENLPQKWVDDLSELSFLL